MFRQRNLFHIQMQRYPLWQCAERLLCTSQSFPQIRAEAPARFQPFGQAFDDWGSHRHEHTMLSYFALNAAARLLLAGRFVHVLKPLLGLAQLVQAFLE